MFGGGFPGGFPGMGGMPGGMGGRGAGNTDSSRYYKLLNVSKNASEAELKKAHRKACLREHPDKVPMCLVNARAGVGLRGW